MFPYRRSGKKRGKGGGGGGGPGQGRIDPRRLPGSVRDVLVAMQPATKALAQMLAGNTRASGQLAHARNLVAQAQRIVDERQLDRVPPLEREEFLELLARLKLTVTDAETSLDDHVPVDRPARPVATVAPERLREMALALATRPTPPVPVPAPTEAAADPEPVAEPEPVAPIAEPEPVREGPRGQRLRLKRAIEPAASSERRAEAG